jgi:hypothetical protein
MKNIIYSVIISIILSPVAVYAADQPLVLKNPLGDVGVTSIQGLISAIIGFIILDIAPPIITIMFLVGAFKMLTAGSNESKFKEGKNTLTYAVIGAAVVLLSYGATDLIKSFLSQGSQ